jgi:hypothetical protein
MSETVTLRKPLLITTPKSRKFSERKAARMDYLNGRGSLRQLAQKYSVCLATMRNWAKQEAWTDVRMDWERRELDIAEPQLPQPAQPIQDDTTLDISPITLRQQIRRMDEMLKSASESNDIIRLMKAKTDAFEMLSRLTGLYPRVASKKGRTGQPAPFVQPVPQATSQPIAQPDTTTGCVTPASSE